MQLDGFLCLQPGRPAVFIAARRVAKFGRCVHWSTANVAANARHGSRTQGSAEKGEAPGRRGRLSHLPMRPFTLE